MYKYYADKKEVKEITLKLLMKEINFYIEIITILDSCGICALIIALPEDEDEKDTVERFGFTPYKVDQFHQKRDLKKLIPLLFILLKKKEK